jgi:hypothetical protein
MLLRIQIHNAPIGVIYHLLTIFILFTLWENL